MAVTNSGLIQSLAIKNQSKGEPMKTTVIAPMLLFLAFLSHAEEKDDRPLIKRYEGSVFVGQMMCKLSLDLANAKGELGEKGDEKSDWRGCIDKHKGKVKVAYDAFAKTVKKPAARAALKEHYILAISFIAGIEPESDEIVLSYKRRQAELKARANEQWTRFEVEN